jgi:hypothetical protein
MLKEAATLRHMRTQQQLQEQQQAGVVGLLATSLLPVSG